MDAMLTRVAHERRSQELCSHPGTPNGVRLAVLMEEVGEVARAMNEATLGNTTPSKYLHDLQDELVQVASVAVAWAEGVQEQFSRDHTGAA